MTYLGSPYCVGFTYGVQRSLYGIGTPLVLQHVTVVSVDGSVIGVSGWPSCGPDEWCGQTLVTISVIFDTSPPLQPGNLIDLYGTTRSGGLTPAAFEVLAVCDPDYWC